MARKKDRNSRYVRYTGLTLCILIIFGLTGCGKDNPITPNNPNPDPENPDTPTEMTLGQTLQHHDDLSKLKQLVIDADMEDMLESEGPYTFLTPVNSAFDNLPEGFLDNLSQEELQTLINYHLIDSEVNGEILSKQDTLHTMMDDPIFVLSENSDVQFNRGLLHGGSNVTDPDINATNGIIHKINGVLLPDIYLDVLAIADKRYNLTKFVCNCTTGEADLQPTLENPDAQFTVFIPDDNAFDDSNVSSLPVSELRKLLEYHIVESKILSGDLSNGQTLETMNGANLTVSVAEDGTITLDGGAATVIEKDLIGINGVVYVIDTVLNPPEQ